MCVVSVICLLLARLINNTCNEQHNPERLPKESKVVVVAYAVSTLGSLIFFLLNARYFVIYLSLWAVTVAVFVWASVYSRKQKLPEMPEDAANW